MIFLTKNSTVKHQRPIETSSYKTSDWFHGKIFQLIIFWHRTFKSWSLSFFQPAACTSINSWQHHKIFFLLQPGKPSRCPWAWACAPPALRGPAPAGCAAAAALWRTPAAHASLRAQQCRTFAVHSAESAYRNIIIIIIKQFIHEDISAQFTITFINLLNYYATLWHNNYSFEFLTCKLANIKEHKDSCLPAFCPRKNWIYIRKYSTFVLAENGIIHPNKYYFTVFVLGAEY